MEGLLHDFAANAHWGLLLLLLVGGVVALGKGADWLVNEAVVISLRSGMPRAVVGATVVSLGTTTPEAAVSVLAALQGEPGLALGNAVGSIICDTGLILGLSCLIAPLPIQRRLVNRQGWVQFGCGWLLVLACTPWSNPWSAFQSGSEAGLAQGAGWVFLALLAAYMIWSVRRAAEAPALPQGRPRRWSVEGLPAALAKLAGAVAVVVISSQVLIAVAMELAERLHVPPSIIAATLVAFGTSLPELVVAVTAVLKKQGELAVGNVIGADILNVLFVAGASASVTRGGLRAEPHFFRLQFPAMLLLLIVFRTGVWRARDGRLKRRFGAILLLTYIAVSLLSYFTGGAAGPE